MDTRSLARRCTAAAATALLLTGALAAAPAQAKTDLRAPWTCSGGKNADNGDAGGVDVFATCSSSGNRVSARFNANGEHLIVCDHYPNGYSTIARLTVEGNGTATYRSSGSGRCTDFNLSFDEGLSASVEVCTAGTSDALCSGRSRGGVT
ncbi:hypothetical protein [Glycomyces sp. YM15]|uniref:hypothetical protein n=1 Tax=Glycomyces sp. YM15 TaxID=2800446 RepID=UPI001963343E|nr:hypothetical protein [Glycomyces sp. YM15]